MNDSPAPQTPTPTAPPPPPGRWSSLPDRLSLVRLAAVPLLWILAALRATTWLGIGVAAAALTDVLDGAIARRMGQTTERGSRLDSIADHTLTISVGIWLLWLRPEFARRELPLLAAWGVLAVAALLVGWLRFHRIVGLHLYSAKLAGTLGYLFAIWLLLFGTYSPAVFYLIFAVCMLAAAESLLVLATRPSVDEHIGTLLRRRGRGDRDTPPAPRESPPPNAG